jgi:hypothetical protein
MIITTDGKVGQTKMISISCRYKSDFVKLTTASILVKHRQVGKMIRKLIR